MEPAQRERALPTGQVQLFGEPEGTPVVATEPVVPPSTIFRGPAGTTTAGYGIGRTIMVSGVFVGSVATAVVRAFDKPRRDRAIFRLEGINTSRIVQN